MTCIVVRRVLLARGGNLNSNTGLGRAHLAVVSLLEKTLVKDWTKAGIIEHSVKTQIVSRVWNRWYKHPALVESQTNSSTADLLHITDQEQAHLVPKNSSIPVAVTVHDLFHIKPRNINVEDMSIKVGNANPNFIRKMDIKKLKNGLQRADLLICISESTRQEVKHLFPGKLTALVRHQIDVDYWNPDENPQPLDLISEFYDTKKCLLITVGSNEPRKRLNLVNTIISCLPSEVSNEINVINIGSEIKLTDEQLVAAFQYADALIFPSVSEGFGYPPAEAMAAGCRVLASDSAAHNEIIPKNHLLPVDELRAWVDAVERVHADWKMNGGEPRKPNLNLINHVRNMLSPEAHGIALSNAYDLLFEE